MVYFQQLLKLSTGKAETCDTHAFILAINSHAIWAWDDITSKKASRKEEEKHHQFINMDNTIAW